jgi:hypothetical protein
MHKQAVLDLSPWSLSKAQTAITCPFKFRAQYIDRRQGQPPTSSAGVIGSAVHKVLEMALQGKSVKDAYTRVLVNTQLTTTEKEEAMSFAHNVMSFVERMEKFKRKTKVDKVFVEHRFGFSVDGQPTGFKGNNVFFRGIWDFAMLTHSKHLIIIDHKTGAKKKIEDHREQLWSYAVSALGIVPDLRGAQSAIHYVGTEELVWDKMLSRNKIEADIIPWFASFLDKAAEAATTGQPKKSWLCMFCGHMDICPLQQKG